MCDIVFAKISSFPLWLCSWPHALQTGWPLSIQCEILRQFPDSSRPCSAALGMLSITHITLELYGCKYAAYNKEFRQLFPRKICSPTFPWFLVKSLTFPWQLSNSRTFPGFPDKWSPCANLAKCGAFGRINQQCIASGQMCLLTKSILQN